MKEKYQNFENISSLLTEKKNSSFFPSEIGEGKYQKFLKIFPPFFSSPFDYFL